MDLFKWFEDEEDARRFFEYVGREVESADLHELKDGNWVVLYTVRLP